MPFKVTEAGFDYLEIFERMLQSYYFNDLQIFGCVVDKNFH